MTPTETVEQIDSAAFIQKRNEAQAEKTGVKPAPVVTEKPAEPKPVEAKEKENDSQQPIPRRARRELNRLRDEAAELRGRLAAYQELGAKPEVAREAVVSEEDPEPQRSGFTSDAEYNRALGRWDARQEAKKVVGSKEESDTNARNMEQYNAHVQAMTLKAVEDSKLIPNYKELAAKAEADETFTVNWLDHKNLREMIDLSESKAFVLTYLVEHKEDLTRLLELTPNLAQQLRLFARLEERSESMYTPKQQKEVVQASPQGKERTTHPAEAQAGRNTPERDAPKPKPSTEVAARGGSAPPEEPLPGSRAWMERRNQVTGGR